MPDKLTVTALSERSLVVTRFFDAPRQMVFDSFTKPELVRRWLLGPPGWTMPVCDIDLRVGGQYRYVWRSGDGKELAMTGIFREIAPPTRLGSTEIYDDDWTGGEAQGLIELTEDKGRTRLVQTMEYKTAGIRDKAIDSGMAQGMEAGFCRLDRLVAA